MRNLLFKLHLYLALFVGLFVVIIGVTGSVMAFEEDIDRLTHPGLFKVKAGGQPLTASELLQAATKASGQKVNSIRLPQSPTDTAGFSVKGPKQMFLNPYTGELVGSRQGASVLSNIHQIHMRLLMGPAGANVVAGVTAATVFLTLSGIYLWWGVKRATVKWSASGRRIAFDIHNTAGIYSVATLFLLAVSGLIIWNDDRVEQWLHHSAGTAKILKNVPSSAPPSQVRINPGQAIDAAMAAIPGAKLLSISMPANAKASYLVALRYPEDLTPGGRSWTNVDQYSGKVVSLQNSRTVGIGTRAIILNRAFHTGDFLGYFSKTIMSLTCLLLIAQSITGYYLWWKKLRARQRHSDAQAVGSYS